jgi:tetratricopeptide (TPR) repeat protein
MAQSLLWIPPNIPDRLNLGEEVIQVSRDAGDHQAWGWGLFMLAATLDQAGELETAVAKMVQALELLKSVPDYQVISYASGILGRCYLRRGEVQQAVAVLEESGQLIDNQRLRGFSCVPVRLYLAQAYLAAAEKAEGVDRQSSLGKAEKACRVALKQGKFDREAMVVAYRMQGTYEWLRNKHPSAQQQWQKSLALAERLGAFYELGLTHLEIGQRLEDSVHLKKAESIFAAIGAKFDLAQAQKLSEELRSNIGSSPI